MFKPRTSKVLSLKNNPNPKRLISRAVEVIQTGGLVCFPTETVYGLGADATNDRAVADIFRAKNRSFENPVALHLHSIQEVPKYVQEISEKAWILMEKFLPGPLMLVFKKNEKVSDIVTGGQRKVGIRIPRHEICLQFLEECGVPVAATSANQSGRLATVKGEQIMQELGGRFDVLLDAGTSPLGIESTVLDVTTDPPRIIRPGFITLDEIAVTLGIPPVISDNLVERGKSRGMLESSSASKLILLEGDKDLIEKKIRTYLKLYSNKKIGIITTENLQSAFKDHSYQRCVGPADKPQMIARKIFSTLREMENMQMDVILMEGIPREGLGHTLMIKLCQMAEDVIKLYNSGDINSNGKSNDNGESPPPANPQEV